MNLHDPERYIDLAKWFEGEDPTNCYTDFEGFADPKGILEKAEKAVEVVCPKEQGKPNQRAIIKTLLVHYLYANLDQVGYEPDDNTMVEIAIVIEMIISCRYFLREDAK